jgi:hypothetical protein
MIGGWWAKPLQGGARRSPDDHTAAGDGAGWRFLSISSDATKARIISVRITSSIIAARSEALANPRRLERRRSKMEVMMTTTAKPTYIVSATARLKAPPRRVYDTIAN